MQKDWWMTPGSNDSSLVNHPIFFHQFSYLKNPNWHCLSIHHSQALCWKACDQTVGLVWPLSGRARPPYGLARPPCDPAWSPCALGRPLSGPVGPQCGLVRPWVRPPCGLVRPRCEPVRPHWAAPALGLWQGCQPGRHQGNQGHGWGCPQTAFPPPQFCPWCQSSLHCPLNRPSPANHTMQSKDDVYFYAYWKERRKKKTAWPQSEPRNSAKHICCLKQSFAHCLHPGSGADCNEQEFLSHDCERSASPHNYNVYLIAAATKQVFSILFTFSSLWLQGSSSNWILMSCQPHRVTSWQSNSGHKQIHISKLFSHIHQPSVKSVYKTSHFTDIKHTDTNIRHKFSKS